jgi:hypothetical protein
MPVKRQPLRSTLGTEDVARVVHGAIRRLGSVEYGWEAAWVDEQPQVRAALRTQIQAIRDRPGMSAAAIRAADGLPPLPAMAMAVEEMIVAIVRALEPVIEE